MRELVYMCQSVCRVCGRKHLCVYKQVCVYVYVYVYVYAYVRATDVFKSYTGEYSCSLSKLLL